MEGSVLWCSCQGQRWRKLLEEVAKGALSEAALVDEARLPGAARLPGSVRPWRRWCRSCGGSRASCSKGRAETERLRAARRMRTGTPVAGATGRRAGNQCY